MKELIRIQKELKAPKNQTNNFGKYKYRSCEDILEAVKPLLGDCLLTISDTIVEVGGRIYVQAFAKFSCGDKEISVTAYARESEMKKGMDESQITGAASSYARKYALNGLFLIDDTKDADTDEAKNQESKPLPELLPTDTKNWNNVVKALGTYTIEQIKTKWSISKENEAKLLKS